MVEASRKVLLLTGSPLPSSLGWTKSELSAPLLSCFSATENLNILGRPTPFSVAPSWRALPLEQLHLPTGLTQASRDDGPSGPENSDANKTSSFTTADLSFDSTNVDEYQSGILQASISDNEGILSQYYEHSFAVHEDIPSSQIVGARSFIEVSFDTEAEEYSTDFSVNSETDPEKQLARSRLASGYLSDLKDMPNATYLNSITPQTMTVNLVVGIISISQPRAIITRKGGRTVELVEMLVGDNTRAGFGITVWLPSLQESNYVVQREVDLRSRVSQLRPQDIVLVRTVALSSFKGRVYGQSLRRGTTTLDLLYRKVVAEDDERGTYKARDLEVEAMTNPQVLKVKRVKDWVMQFVGANAGLPTFGNGLVNPLILVGGYGTRLRPLTLTLPKPLVEFANKPMIEHQVESLAAAGVTDIVLAVNYRPDIMAKALQKYEDQYNVKIEFSIETEPLGTAGPLKLAEKTLGKDDSPFFVLNADVICEYPFKELAEFHKAHGEEGTIVVTKVEEPSKYGVIVHKPDHASRIDRFVEKPVEFVGNRINAGLYILSPSVLTRIDLRPTSIEQETFPAMVRDGQLHSFDLEGFWMDVGQPKDFISGTCLYLSALTKKGSKKLEPPSKSYVYGGNVLVDPSAKIGKNCRIGPNVTIGPNVVVGDGVRLQRCVILSGSKIKDHAWVKSTIVGWNSTIGRWARLENVSVLGDDVTIGDEIYVNGGSVLPHKSIKQNVDSPAIIM